MFEDDRHLQGIIQNIKVCGVTEIWLPLPTPSCKVVLPFELPVDKRKQTNKYPKFNWKGGVWIILFSLVTPLEDNFSITFILSPIVANLQCSSLDTFYYLNNFCRPFAEDCWIVNWVWLNFFVLPVGCNFICIWLCLDVCQHIWTLSPILPGKWESGLGGHQSGRTRYGDHDIDIACEQVPAPRRSLPLLLTLHPCSQESPVGAYSQAMHW